MSKTDREFYKLFHGGMEMLGLPCPESLFGNLTVATGLIGGMANAIKILGTKVTVREIILTVPLAGAGAATAAGIHEVVLMVGAMSAAFYIGACVGCLLAAAFHTYGMAGVASVGACLKGVERDIGGLWEVIKRAAVANPRLATLTQKAHLFAAAGVRT